MDTPTYNQYCLQSLDASNTFQHSEAWFQEDKARDKAINDFSDISDPKIEDKYLFYRGIKGKRTSLRYASTKTAYPLGLFAPVKDDKDKPSITSEDLCFVYTYDNIFVVKMINKTKSSFYINPNRNTMLRRGKKQFKTNKHDDSERYKETTFKSINKVNNLIEMKNVKNTLNIIGSEKTIVEVYLDPLLCLQSALCVSNGYASWADYPDWTKGRIFLNCLKYWHLNKDKQTDTNSEIILNILNMCLVNDKKNIMIIPLDNHGRNGRVDATVKKNLTELLSYLIIYQKKGNEPEKSIQPKSKIDVDIEIITYNIKKDIFNKVT